MAPSSQSELIETSQNLLRSLRVRRVVIATVFAGGTLAAFMAFLVGFVIYHSSLATPVAVGSHITLAMTLSVGFLGAIVAITICYTWLAGRVLDPLIARLRAQIYGH